jgi:hypothetical protein
MSVAFGYCRCCAPQQSSDDLQAEPARNEMGCISVPVVVSAVVGNASARRCLSPMRIQRSTARSSPEKAPASLGPAWHFWPTPSAALRYWNMARQRYCRRLARYRYTRRVSADPVANPAAHTCAESRGSRPMKADAGERRTLRWRERDSNPRSPERGTTRAGQHR